MAIPQKESKERIYLRLLAYKNMRYAFAGLVYKEEWISVNIKNNFIR